MAWCWSRKKNLFTPSLLTQGRTDDLLWRMASCSKGKNASRGLTRLIYNFGCSLEIDIDYVEVTCRKRRPKIHDVQLPWPVLRMKSWCKFIFETHPSLLLGGYDLSSSAKWQGMFQEFWDRYRDIEGNHDIYTSGKPLSHCIPFAIHGDEGVTHRRRAFMVQSWQPIISFRGTGKTAVSGNHGEKFQTYFSWLYYFFLLSQISAQTSPPSETIWAFSTLNAMRPRDSFCSRLLYCCISASAFSGEKTLAQLNTAWTNVMLELYASGFEVPLVIVKLNHLVYWGAVSWKKLDNLDN